MLPWYRIAILFGIILPLHAQDTPPGFPKDFAGRAEFETTAGFREAGWASLVTARQGSDAYILSVRYLLGPGGGFPSQVAAADVPSFVRSIKIDSFSGGAHNYIVDGLPIAAPDFDPLRHPPDNLAVYRLHNATPAEPDVLLATQLPAKGETVWLMTEAAGPDLSVVAATVISNKGDGWLTVRLNSGALDKDPSGAPVLNGAGELVGVYSHRDIKNPSVLKLIPAVTILKVLPALPPLDN